MMGSIFWTPGISLAAIEKEIIQAAFRFYRENKTATATSLGIAVRTLDNKLEQYQKEEKDQEDRARESIRERTEFLKRQRGNPPNNEGIPYSPAPHGILAQGSRMESLANSASQHPVSVQKSQEVQSVLPKPAPANSQHKKR